MQSTDFVVARNDLQQCKAIGTQLPDAAALPDDALLTRGWRAKYVLPELLPILDGKRSLRIADVKAEAPFAFENS